MMALSSRVQMADRASGLPKSASFRHQRKTHFGRHDWLLCVVVFAMALTLDIASGAGPSNNGPQSRRNHPKCQEITIPMCEKIGYNMTYMPNQFNHETQEEAGLEVSVSHFVLSGKLWGERGGVFCLCVF